MRLSFIILLFLSTSIDADPAAGSAALEPPTLQPLISKANVLLSAGQYGEAARTYSEAIEQSPTNYLLYYKRATAYLSQSRHEQALADFDQVLSLTGGSFDKALLSKARIFAKEARWSEAREMVKAYTKKNKGDADAGDLLFSISEAEVAMKKAKQAQKTQNWDACIEESSKVLQTATHSVPLRQLRADCSLAKGDVEQTVADLIRLTHLTAPSTSALHHISALAYFLLPASTQALSTLKQCLHYDPDSKLCASAHRQIKKLDRTFAQIQDHIQASEWHNVIKTAGDFAHTFDESLDKALEDMALPATIAPKKKSPRRKAIQSAMCKAYLMLALPRKGEPWCEQVLNMEGGENDMDALTLIGEAALVKEEWEAAVRYLDKAFEASGRSNNDIHQRLQKAHRLLKQSKKKDYYKIMGVSRDADLRTIKKAYRTAAKSAHPDKGGSEKQMAALNEAYEVLSNEELRARYDNGDDPNDPSSGPGSYGNPFAQGGNPFQFVFQQGSHGAFGREGNPFQGGNFKFSFNR